MSRRSLPADVYDTLTTAYQSVDMISIADGIAEVQSRYDRETDLAADVNARLARQATQCRAQHPTNDTVVACCLTPGHDGDHWSTTGCSGSAMSWPATVSVRLDGLADKIAAEVHAARCKSDHSTPSLADLKIAVRIVALLQSLAVQ